MAIVASLDVVLRAITSQFDTPLKKSQTRFQAFAAQLSKFGGTFGGIFGGLGTGSVIAAGTAAVAGFGYAIQRAAEDVDRLIDTGETLGINLNDLKAIELVGKKVGIGIEKIEVALVSLSRRASEAAIGKGGAADAFEELGLAVKDFTFLTPDMQLSALAAAMDKVTNSGDKLRLATALFGKSGAAMIRVLNAGPEAIENTRARMDALGGTITLSTIEAVNNLDDAVNDLQDSWDAVARSALTKWAPALEALAEEVNPERLREWADWFVWGIPGRVVRNQFDNASGSLHGMQDLLRANASPMAMLQRVAPPMTPATGTKEAADGLSVLTDLYQENSDAIEISNAALQHRVRLGMEAAEAFHEELQNLEKAPGLIEFLAESYEELDRVIERSNEIHEAMLRDREKAEDAIIDARDERISRLTALGNAPTPGAVSGAEAFSAFRQNARGKSTADAILEENKRATKLLERIEKNKVALLRAEL